jgi:hypothetical protein
VIVVDVASLERYDITGGGLRSVTLPVSVTELAWRDAPQPLLKGRTSGFMPA